ncbi:MAG: phosphoribosylanthranilate isomerase [Prevotella sp.]|nr:phosphoribosylanthranilate isomerase [Prevotella sp.]
MIVKVCGMREADNIRAVSELGVDMLGFDFRPESQRFVAMVTSRAGIIPDYSEEQMGRYKVGGNALAGAAQSAQPLRVGVFSDDMPQNIVTRVYNYQLDYVQLNGSESRVMIENLKRTLEPDIRRGVRVIKTLLVITPDDILKYKEYEGVADMYLFVVKSLEEQADWNILNDYDGQTPFLLGGCIGLDDAERIAAFRHPRFAGVSVSSQFETEPGVKDVEKLRRFMTKIS